MTGGIDREVGEATGQGGEARRQGMGMRRSRQVASLVVVGVVAYAAIDALLVRLEPGYAFLRNAESDYGVGPYGWVMSVNFVLRGAISLAGAATLWPRLRRSGSGRLGAGLLCLWGLASALLAFFPDDPPGNPATTSGAVHLQLALVAFLAVAAATILLSVVGRGDQALGRWRPALLGLSLLALLPLLLLGHLGARPSSHYGLYERLFLGLELLWLGLACGRLAWGPTVLEERAPAGA